MKKLNDTKIDTNKTAEEKRYETFWKHFGKNIKLGVILRYI